MSQNQGGLTEDELRDYINDKYSLRLERDIFIKPNKDVIFDIYQRFLDEVCPSWRRYQGTFKGCEEQAPLKLVMVKFLKIIVRIYNNSYVFNITDLTSPSRQRTRLTINILIYHRERALDILAKWHEDKEELMVEREEMGRKKDELSRRKDRVEELAIAISTSKPVDDSKLSIIEKERELDYLKKECDDIATEAKDIKAKVLLERERVQKEETQAEVRHEEIKKLKKQLESLNNGLHIEQKTANTERMISEEENQLNFTRTNIMKAKKKEKDLERLVSVQRLLDTEGAHCLELTKNRIENFGKDSCTRKADIDRLKSTILAHQKKEEIVRKKLTNSELNLQKRELLIRTDDEKGKIKIEARKSEIRDRERILLKEEAQENKDMEEIRKSRADFKSRLDEELEKHKRFMERADRRVRLFEEHYQKSKELISEHSILAERRDKINALIGGVEMSETTMVDMPANRTYIKDKGINN